MVKNRSTSTAISFVRVGNFCMPATMCGSYKRFEALLEISTWPFFVHNFVLFGKPSTSINSERPRGRDHGSREVAKTPASPPGT